jgi:hypothetical protein
VLLWGLTMSDTFVSCLLADELGAGRSGVWFDDSSARVVLFMAGLQILMDPELDSWAERVGRDFVLTAKLGGSGTVNPGLWAYRHNVRQSRAIVAALRRVVAKLERFGQTLPGRFWDEHDLLETGEAIPSELALLQHPQDDRPAFFRAPVGSHAARRLPALDFAPRQPDHRVGAHRGVGVQPAGLGVPAGHRDPAGSGAQAGAETGVAPPPGCQRGLCPTCGYDLTGNTSGVCPECGMPLVASMIPAADARDG